MKGMHLKSETAQLELSDLGRGNHAGRKYVQARHDWDKITASLELFYHSSIDQPGE